MKATAKMLLGRASRSCQAAVGQTERIRQKQSPTLKNEVALPHTALVAMTGWLPVGILLLAFALRLVTIESRPLWYDDAFSVFLAERGPAAIASGTAADTMPPGYYLLLFGWMNAFGETPLAMRMLSVTLSLLVVALVYAAAKRGVGAQTANWAAFLTALMPFQIYHAQELRMYTLLAVGVLLYVYGVMGLALKQGGGRAPYRSLVFVALGTAVALYSHNLAFVSLLAGNLYLLVRRDWRREIYLILGQVVGAIFFTPWLLYVPTQLEKIQRAFWTQTPGLLDVVQMLLVFTAYLPLPPLLIPFALIVSILVLVLLLWQLVKLARRQKLPALGLLVAFAVIPPVLLFILSYLIRPVFVPRGVIGSALAYVILLGVVIARAPRGVQIGAAVVTLAAAALLLPFYYSAFGEWRRAPYSEANAYLGSQWNDGDVILHDNKLTFFPMHLYDRALPQVFLADPPQSDNDTFAPASQAAMGLYPTDFDTAVQGHPRVWFVIYQTALDEAQAANQPHANLARLDRDFQRVQASAYGDLRIFLYTTR